MHRRTQIQSGFVIVPLLCSWFLCLGVALASPWPVTPEQAGEPFDPPPKGAPELHLPQGATNLAAGKPVTSSVKDPVIGYLGMITDGDKGGWESADGVYVADEGHYVEIGQGAQYVQVDLQEDSMIDAVWIWHRHPYEGYEVPRDIVVQVADEASLAGGVITVFNSDSDDSLGLGRGADRRYATSRFGKLIPVAGVPGRYVRIWFNGGARTDLNTLVEAEIYGRTIAFMRQQEGVRLHALHRERFWRWILTITVVAIPGIGLGILIRRTRKRKRCNSLADRCSESTVPNKDAAEQPATPPRDGD